MPMPLRSNVRRQAEIENIFRGAGVSRGMSVRLSALRMPDNGRAAAGEDGGFEWILTTEKPAVIWDWDRWEFVEEILLADGMLVPAIGQVVLLDSHNRNRCADVFGHVTGFAEAQAGEFAARTGRVFFAADAASVDARGKVEGNHITDGSVGYAPVKSIWVPSGEQVAIGGRIFDGGENGMKITYQWLLREFSLTPIGADVLAKVRLLCGA